MKLPSFNPFTLLVGARYGISRRHSQLVSFISSLSTAGLVIGVALLIVVMSVMNGFDREFRERILAIMPHVTLYHREGIENPDQYLQQFKQDTRVQSVEPFVQLQGLLAFQKKVAPANLFGVQAKDQQNKKILLESLPKGSFTRLEEEPNGIIIGKGVAEKLGVVAGDKLTLIVPKSGDQDAAPSVQILTLIAVMQTNTEIDQGLALMSLKGASALSEFPGRATGIRLQLNDLFSAPELAYEFMNQLPVGFYASDWTRTHGNIYQSIHMSKQLVSMLLFLIIGIAAFNLVSTLVMVVVDKQGDIAILRTLGASEKEIIGIFMVQGGLIGVIGTSVGVVLGVAGSQLVTGFVAGIEKLFGFQFLHSDVYPVSYLPSELYWGDVVQIALTSLVICFFSALYPAWRASKILPAEALRYE